MTYRPWNDVRREPSDRGDLRDIEHAFVAANPWISANLHFAAFRDMKVLEVGCGAGAATCLFAQAGAHVDAVDITDKAVALTLEQASARNLTVTAHRMDAEALEFPADHFDHVFAWGVLHHSADPERAFSEVARVLRPGGSALIMVYNRLSLRYYVRGLQYLLLQGKLFSGENLASVQRFFTDGYYHRHFTSRELRRALTDAAFTVTRIVVTHMAKQMVPCIPVTWDKQAKARLGWLLVAEVRKPQGG